MRRADRLFELVQRIRGRRLSTAEQLAQALEVSVRTVYRDIADLQARGVPIDGEAGVGYRMQPGYTLPPLMFTSAEAQALVAAVRMAQPRMDVPMAAEAEATLGKILSVLSREARAAAESVALYAFDTGIDAPTRERLLQVRRAVIAKRKLRMRYADGQSRATERTVRPLGCFFWGAVWTMAAWCETRDDFRSFRLDRIKSLHTLEEGFRDEPGKTLAELLRLECKPGAAPSA
jgi:predicted DNA-binding transcriptional regulator YafY